jgi:Domain of unknown function DUF29
MARANPVTEERRSLYERDYYLWLEQQASRLREGLLDELDVANLLEEIEDMGRTEKRAIEGNLIVLLTHLLKYRLQPDQTSSSWRGSIVEHRRRLRKLIRESPSLLATARGIFPSATRTAASRLLPKAVCRPIHSRPNRPSRWSRSSTRSTCRSDGGVEVRSAARHCCTRRSGAYSALHLIRRVARPRNNRSIAAHRDPVNGEVQWDVETVIGETDGARKVTTKHTAESSVELLVEKLR